MNRSFRALLYGCSTVLALALPGAAQERWELGVFGGYAFSTDATVSNQSGQVNAGIRPGYVFGVVAGNEVRSWLSGEVRYTYRDNELRLSGNGAEARFAADSHSVHYDFVFQGGGRGSRGIRPFVAAGAGIRYFRGTGVEASAQPLNRFAILTRTSEIRPLLSVGAGVKVPLSSLLSLRIEARDYMTKFPREVIAPVPGAQVGGWLHDITPTVGLSFTF